MKTIGELAEKAHGRVREKGVMDAPRWEDLRQVERNYFINLVNEITFLLKTERRELEKEIEGLNTPDVATLARSAIFLPIDGE